MTGMWMSRACAAALAFAIAPALVAADTAPGPKFVKSGGPSGLKKAVNSGIQSIGLQATLQFTEKGSGWRLLSYEPGLRALYEQEDGHRAAIWAVEPSGGSPLEMETRAVDDMIRDQGVANAPFGPRTLVGTWERQDSILSGRPLHYTFLAKDADGQRWAVRVRVRYREVDLLFQETSLALDHGETLNTVSEGHAQVETAFLKNLTVSFPVKR